MKPRLAGPLGHLVNPGTRLLKRLCVTLVCVLAFVLVVFFTLRSLFPSGRLREAAVSKLEETTGLSFSVQGAAISFVHWRVGVKVSGVEIFAPAAEAFADSADRTTQPVRIATIPRVGIVVSILPLLKREIVVDELYVERPRLTLLLGGGPILRRQLPSRATRPVQIPMSFSLSKAVVNDADVELRDVRSGSVVELSHVDVSSRVRTDINTGTLLFEGKSWVKKISTSPVNKLSSGLASIDARVSWSARLKVREKLFELENCSVRVLGFPVQVSGKVSLAGEKPDLDVKVRIEKTETGKMLVFVPKKFLDRIKNATMDGHVVVYATVRGKMPSPDVDVEKFSISIGGSSVRGRAHVKTQEPSSLSFESSGNLKLDELAAALPAGKGVRVRSGTASFEIAGGGLVKELRTDPLSLQVRGQVRVNSVNIELPQPSPEVVLEKANLVLSGRRIEINEVVGRAGSSVFSATGRVRDWKDRSIELEVRSPMLDLGGLLVAFAGQQTASKGKGEPKATSVAGIPVRTSASVHVERLKFGDFTATDLDAAAVLEADSIVVSGVTMNALGGKCNGRTRVFLAGKKARTYSAAFSADNLQMKELLNSLTPAKDFMNGLSFFEVSVEGQLPENRSPLTTLVATGQVRTTQAEAIASPFVSAIASWVGLDGRNRYALRDFATSFRVQQGRVILPQCRLEEKNSSWDFAGSTGFDGTLDYRVNVTLSQEYSKRTGSLNGLDRLLKDDQGRVVVDLIVGGTVKKPVFKWDKTRMEQRGRDYLAREVRGRLETQAKRGEELKQGVRRELEGNADSLKVETAKKGAKFLEQLLKSRK